MSLIHFDGFDYYDDTILKGEIATLVGQCTYGGAYVGGGTRFGVGQAMYAWGGTGIGSCSGYVTVRRFAPFTRAVTGFAFTTDTVSSSTRIVSFCEASGDHLVLAVTDPGYLAVYRGGTLLQTGTTPILVNKWYYLEIDGTISDTVGAYEVRINGVTEMAASGIDTRSGGTGVCDGFTFGNAGGRTQGFDDWYVDTDTFQGDVRIVTMRPTGAGAHADFTPSAGANWQNVDETTPDADTTYNYSTVQGSKDTFVASDPPVSGGSILGVKRIVRHRKDDAGSRVIRNILRIGGTDYEGASHGTLDSYSYGTDIDLVSPDTGVPFTLTELNNMEIGYKVEV